MSIEDDPLRDRQSSGGIDNPFEGCGRPLGCITLPVAARSAPLPFTALESGPGSGRSNAFVYSCVSAEAHLVSLAGGEVRCELQRVESLSLLHVARGSIALIRNGETITCHPGGWMVVPGGSISWQSTPFSVVSLMVSPSQLLTLCEQMIPSPSRFQLPDWQLVNLGAGSHDHAHRERLLIRALRRTILTMGDCVVVNQKLIHQLRLEDQLCRLVCLLLLPGLQDALLGEAAGLEDDTLVGKFDDLLAYIDANLEQPLNLTLLQSRIHYSRRAVQYAFQKQLGCTATQWIRARRLDKAHALLKQADASDSVARIAQACGYRSMSLFSIEFQQRFHIKPSILLRQGWLERPADPSSDPDPRDPQSPPGGPSAAPG